MACVSKFWADGVSVAPVDGGLAGASEEVSVISSHRDGGASSHDLGFTLNVKLVSSELSDGTVSRSDKEIVVTKKLHDVNSSLEKSLGWSNSLKETSGEGNLDDVSGESSEISHTVVWGNNDALIDSLNLSHGQVLVKDSLLDEIAVPNTDSVVVDGDKVVVSVVKESNLICNVHTNGMATDSLASLDLNKFKAGDK